jgi:integrase
MSKHLSFKEVAVRYLNKPTKKLGRAKNANAYSTLEWMYEKRPSMILIEGRKKPVPYGRKNSQRSHKVVSWDETSGRFADVAMKDIANIDVEDMETDLRNAKGLSNSGINTYLVYLRAVCNFAHDKLNVSFVRFPKIETLPTKEREYYLTPEIAKGWIKFLDPLRADMVRFGLATGQRKANIIGLKWSWLSKDLTRMVIPADDAKNGCSHTIQLNKMAIEVLTKRLNDRTVLLEKYPRLGNIEYVFVQDDCQHLGQPMSTWAVTNEMWKRSIRLYNQNLMHRAAKDNRSVDRAKLIPEGALVFHTLRHSFATWLNEAGTDLDDIAMVGGWKSLDACRRYVKKSEDRAREVGSRIEHLL